MKNKSSPCRAVFGFSLVEVTVTLGIMSIGLVTLLGLVPVGLDALHAADAENVRAQVVQNISGKALLTPFADLDKFVAAGPYHFDDNGLPQTSEDVTTRFIVNLDRLDTTYPGSSLADGLAESVTTLRLQVQTLPGQSAPARYVLHLSNQGE